MKFTKQEAFEKLKGELTKGGKTLRLTERSINTTLDTLMPLLANDETELDVFFKAALPIVSTQNANVEKDNADFVKMYKEKNPLNPNPDPDLNPDPDKDKNKKDPIQERLERLEAQLAEKERKEKIGSLRSTLLSKLGEKGVDKEWANEFISEINITEDFDVDKKTESYLKIYNKSKAEIPSIITPKTPKGEPILDEKELWSDLKPKKD